MYWLKIGINAYRDIRRRMIDFCNIRIRHDSKMETELVNLLLAFVTGLTTGGLSCLAVQGGLLASSLSGQIEKDVQNTSQKNRKSKTHSKTQFALPISIFLIAKLVAYTILGVLLGWLGQVFQLSPITRAILQIAIGIFMVGSALRMLNVHPIFRIFAFEPPAFLRRWLRKKSKEDQSSLFTPAFMGILTVLIPCGVTQAMMAAALSTGDPIESGTLMFAFTLGTSPVFFAVSYFATQLGKKLEKYFVYFVAVILIVVGFITINSGLTLAGSRFSVTNLMNSVQAQTIDAEQPLEATAEPITTNEAAAGETEVIQINVQNNGYEPNVIHATAGVPIQLRLVTDNVRSCSRAFTIPSLNIQQLLDQTGEASIDIPAQTAGSQLPFSCSMGMYGGIIYFE